MGIGAFFDFLVILSVAVWLIGLAANGALSPESTAVILICVVFFVALGRLSGIGVVRLAFRIGVPLASLATFVMWYGEGTLDEMVALLLAVLPLLIALFGVYLMVGALFREPRRHR